MDWARILAYVTGTVDQELLGRNEYLAAENRIMKARLKGRLKLLDAEAEIAPAPRANETCATFPVEISGQQGSHDNRSTAQSHGA